VAINKESVLANNYHEKISKKTARTCTITNRAAAGAKRHSDTAVLQH
jgi:hypothetical protein